VTAAAPAAAAGPVAAPAAVASSLTDAGGEISKAEVDDAAGEAAAAKKAAGEARGAASATEKEVVDAEERTEQAKEQLAAAREEAQPAAAELESALEASADADAEVLAAKQEQRRLAQVAHTYSPTNADVLAQERADEAAKALEEVQQQAAEAVSAAAAEYEEYRVFEQDVLAAEEAFATADEEARAARAKLERQAAEAEAASAEAEKRQKAAAEVREAWKDQGLHPPATGGVTSPFGPRVHPVTGVYKLHTGTDFEGQDGNYYAMADGTVSYAAYDGAYGYMVKIDHGTMAGHQVESWYAHQPGVSVSVGQKVSKGEVIGRIGNSGYSTGPHAHVELHLDGAPVDLMEHLH
jgi:murein DD-endopeptidase MepM/ murein hydrolase activator NlpD